MIGRIIGIACCLLCAFPFLIISWDAKNSQAPINFWSGDNSLKNKVENVKEYNSKMAELYQKCSLVFVASGIIFFILPVMGVVYIVLECTIGIYFVWKSYKKILGAYS